VAAGARIDARVHKMMCSMRRNIEQLSLLVGRALDASTLTPDALPEPDRQYFELRPLVGTVAEKLEPLARAGGTRIANTVPERLVVHADAWLLARVFQNLLANAIEHTPGGEIIVGAEATSRGESVVCWVRDDGVGIKGEATRPRHGARGFGLPIVEQVVEAHGGRVAVESAAGFGATFWFELPASGPTPPPAG
jgi:signal transduction histidine kinase